MKRKNKTRKILLKVLTPQGIKWVHLCHLDTKLYEQFCESLLEGNSTLLPTHISRWVKEDFSTTLAMSHKADIESLKRILTAWYSREYPELYLKSCPGANRISGLMNVWMTQHIQYDLENYNKGVEH